MVDKIIIAYHDFYIKIVLCVGILKFVWLSWVLVMLKCEIVWQNLGDFEISNRVKLTV